MILRSLVVLAALLVVPALADAADAQEPPRTATDRTHVVREGETLASIARQHFGATASWVAIFEANRGLVTDPDRILPGMELTIPAPDIATGAAAGVRTGAGDVSGIEVIRGRPETSPLAEVVGVELSGQLDPGDPALPVVVDPSNRRELLQTRPFTALGAPEVDPADRTVFHGLQRGGSLPETIRPGVILAQGEEVLAVPRSVFHSAAWLVREGTPAPSIGRILEFEGDAQLHVHRRTLQPYDEVRIDLTGSAGLEAGDRILAFRELGEVDGYRVVTPTGVLEIRRLEAGGGVARLVTEYERVQLGHGLVPMRTFPLTPGVHPSTTDIRLEGTLIGFRDRKEIYLPGDQAFIDRGRDDGLVVGDELVGQVGRAEGREGRRVARFQVITVQDGTATVRMLSVESPSAVRTGLAVALDRKMP